MISDEDKERVRQATDFVTLVGETVELRQRGQEFWGCCPFHGEKSPSFKVNPNTGLWHCFGCGDGGDVFSYVQRRENLDFLDSVRYLADRAGIELSEERGGQRGPKKSRLVECLCETESFFSTMLMRGRGEGPDAARGYLSSRGFGAAVCRDWGLGYAPGRGALVSHLREKGFSYAEMIAGDVAVDRNGRTVDRFYERVMFPIHDEMGRTIAFGGRVIGPKKDTAKYINTRDTSVFNKGKHLFAYDRAKEGMAATGVAIVCEGYTDVIAMHQAGYTNAVAALGTAFRLDHIKLMERQRVSKIICMFDGDAAGQRAAERAVQFIDKTSCALLCVVLPNNQDPMEFLSANGAEAMRPYLDGAGPLMDFVFDKRLGNADLGTPGRRVKALEDMAKVLAPLKHSLVLGEYATRLADILGFDVADVKAQIQAAPVEKDEEAGRRQGSGNRAFGGQQAGRAGQQAGRSSRPAPAAQPAPPAYPEDDYDPAAYDYAPVPDDYVPYDDYQTEYDDGYGYDAPAGAGRPAAPARGASLNILSDDDRLQYAAEVELLSFMAAKPAEVKPYGERLADIVWVDSRHEAICWAMLATPDDATCADIVAAATAVEPTAPKILSGSKVMAETGMTDERKVEVLLDTLDLYSTKRQVRDIRAQLKRTQVSPEATNALFTQATELQKKINALVLKLSRSSEN